MPDAIIIREEESSLKKERFSPELLRRFVEATKKLAVQGERLQQAHTGTDMILFVGRSGNDIIDIQIQNGPEIQQLFVTLIGQSESYQLKINHQHKEPIFSEDVERFLKGSFDPKLRQTIEDQYPRFITRIQHTIPGAEADFAQLTEALESTTLDKRLLEKTVKHDTTTGNYVRAKQTKPKFFEGVIATGKKMLTD
ncbi:MAG: hypothetical protein KKB74_02795 [Bacteroidetes bacterium]|nr:hypothetical protein [Bacteroidota bacterium]